MSKNTPFPSRRRTRIATPQGLKPLNLATTRERAQEAPAPDADERGDALTLVSPADWVCPSTPGYEMSASDAERRGRLQSLIARLQSGKNVRSSDIKSALTTVEWEKFEAKLPHLKIPPEPRRILSMFKDYVDAIRKADFLYYRAESSHSAHFATRHVGLRRIRSLATQAESAYEDAYEILEGLIERDPSIAFWLDRPVRSGMIEGTATLEPMGVPRPKWSRSKYALMDGKPKQTARSWKLSTLMDSLDNLDRPHVTGRRGGSGIGDAPVIPGIEDQWVFDGDERRVV